MATEVNLPALGESVTEGTVTRWLKQVGDEVAVDEPLLEVSTDKVDTEIPSPVAGTLLEIKANEDDTVEVGAVLGLIGNKDESGGSGADDSGSDTAQEQAEESSASDEAAAETWRRPRRRRRSRLRRPPTSRSRSRPAVAAVAVAASPRRSRCLRWASP
jgi:2-oxoglutarate dehydrogenase E2 component (dihydrolipoamide succinyltransferase)